MHYAIAKNAVSGPAPSCDGGARRISGKRRVRAACALRRPVAHGELIGGRLFGDPLVLSRRLPRVTPMDHFLRLIRELIENPEVQRQLLRVIGLLLPPTMKQRALDYVTQLVGGNSASLAGNLRDEYRRKASDARTAINCLQSIQNMFNQSGITQSSIDNALAQLKNNNQINVSIKIEIANPVAIKDADISVLRAILEKLDQYALGFFGLEGKMLKQKRMRELEHAGKAIVDDLAQEIAAIGEKIVVLFLSADPAGVSSQGLRLAKEIKEIENALNSTEERRRFSIVNKGAIQVTEIPGYIMAVKPGIVHFSGHGTRSTLFLENEDGSGDKRDIDLLESVFRVHSAGIRLVILNACYSAQLAERLFAHVDYTIGMSQEVADDSAIAFSIGFYQAFGFMAGVRKAFENGRLYIRMKNPEESDIPVLFARE
jgi:hypothetical protein